MTRADNRTANIATLTYTRGAEVLLGEFFSVAVRKERAIKKKNCPKLARDCGAPALSLVSFLTSRNTNIHQC